MPAINAPGQTSADTPRRQASFQTLDVTLSPASVAANTTAEQTFTVTGLKAANTSVIPNQPGDTILAVIKPTAQAGLGIVGWRVSADNTLAITFSNNTAGAIVPTASQVYRVAIMRQYQSLSTFDG